MRNPRKSDVIFTHEKRIFVTEDPQKQPDPLDKYTISIQYKKIGFHFSFACDIL